MIKKTPKKFKRIGAHGGGELQPLLINNPQAQDYKKLTRLKISAREVGDLMMLGNGAFTPLTGFMGQEDWHNVCVNLQTTKGIFWPLPITLSTSKSAADKLAIGQEILLSDNQGSALATMVISEKYPIDKHFEAQHVFGTGDFIHPGVSMLHHQGEINLAGEVKVLTTGKITQQFGDICLSPQQTRAIFDKLRWKTVAAFQTRNPLHRAHEHLTKIALELCDGVLIHSLLGNLKPGDIPATVRIKAIDALIKNYYVAGSVINAGYPLDMRYAGPREALLHAIFRQNYGCDYLVIGRDHAGVGDFYSAYAAQDIFDQIPANALKIKPLKIDWTFFCRACDGMASTKTCPHSAQERLLISGTQLRNMLSYGEPIPKNFSRPEVLEVLMQHYRAPDHVI